jgi:hypothetical protein
MATTIVRTLGVVMAEQPPKKPSSLKQRGANAARRVTDPIASGVGAFTGKGIEQEVAAYSETFTQVALGLHEDVAALSRRVEDLEKRDGKLPVTPNGGVATQKLALLAIGVASMALASAVVALVLAL